MRVFQDCASIFLPAVLDLAETYFHTQCTCMCWYEYADWNALCNESLLPDNCLFLIWNLLSLMSSFTVSCYLCSAHFSIKMFSFYYSSSSPSLFLSLPSFYLFLSLSLSFWSPLHFFLQFTFTHPLVSPICLRLVSDPFSVSHLTASSFYTSWASSLCGQREGSNTTLSLYLASAVIMHVPVYSICIPQDLMFLLYSVVFLMFFNFDPVKDNTYETLIWRKILALIISSVFKIPWGWLILYFLFTFIVCSFFF